MYEFQQLYIYTLNFYHYNITSQAQAESIREAETTRSGRKRSWGEGRASYFASLAAAVQAVRC